jgi:hypothetical protein
LLRARRGRWCGHGEKAQSCAGVRAGGVLDAKKKKRDISLLGNILISEDTNYI